MLVRGVFGEYLAAGAPFAAGGSARLFRCRPRGYVYKAYRIPVDEPAEIDRLRRVREVGRHVLLGGGEQATSTPQSSVNWPVDIIEAPTAAITGVIIPEIPERFFTPSGIPRGLDFLILARADPPPARIRLAVLIRLAEIFAWLDAEDLVHGDLSQRNVVWCQVPEPGAYLLDADSIRPRRPTPTVGLATPGWTDPRLAAGLIPAHDHHSDAYALALAMYRGLLLNPGYLERTAEGTWPKPAVLPADLDPAVRELLERSLGSPLDPAARATPREWVQVLVDTYVTAHGFDTSKLRVLDRHAQRYRDDHQRKQAAPIRPTRPPPRPITARPLPGPAPMPRTSRAWGLVGAVTALILCGALAIGLMVLGLQSAKRSADSNRVKSDGGFSGDGGPANAAELDRPSYLATDAKGNLYIADTGNRRVRRVDPQGVITTVAGGGGYGPSDDRGPATAARLLRPTGLAVDASGNLYIADMGQVLRVDPSGTITTVVGRKSFSGATGHAEGKLSHSLEGLAVDAAGNLYIAEERTPIGGGRVVRVDRTGVITTVAGDGGLGRPGGGGPATAAQLEDPAGLAVDSAGNLYIADGCCIRRMDAAGIITTVASLNPIAPRTTSGLAVDGAGNVYAAQYWPFVNRFSRVARVGPDRVITTVAGGGFPGDDGTGGESDLSSAKGLAVDAAGNLYIADSGHHRVVRVSPLGDMTTVAGTR